MTTATTVDCYDATSGESVTAMTAAWAGQVATCDRTTGLSGCCLVSNNWQQVAIAAASQIPVSCEFCDWTLVDIIYSK